MRAPSTSATSAVPPHIVAARGCAPPIPPRPAVTTRRPASEPSGDDEVAAGRLGEGLVRALQDPLRADVDPGSRRHLSVHRQAEGLETAELVPRRPVRHEVGIRQEDARGVRVCPEHPHRLSRLHEERFVVAEAAELLENRRETRRVPGGLPRSAVDDEVLAALGDLRVEVVQEHPVGSLREPRTAHEGRPLRKRRRRERCGGRSAWHPRHVSRAAL